MTGLFLGPIAFQDFEIPARIVFGGRQRLAIHQMPGGGRVIDAMGRDDSPLAWTGTFSGSDAAARALQIDLMRAQGVAWPLAWDVFSYLVVVSEFAASYERGNWIPYRIVCSVLADETAALVQAGMSLIASVTADLATASGLAGVDLSAATMALGISGAASPGSNAYAAATAALGGAAAGLSLSLSGGAANLSAAGDFPSVAAAAQGMAQLAAAQGYVRRAQANLANAGS